MPDDLEELEATFASTPAPAREARPAPPNTSVTTDYESKLRKLGKKWHSILDLPGGYGYDSASEADMALIDRMVKCNFTEGEIWRTLEGSPRLADRIDRKGEKHARDLYTNEIAKAQREVTPFADDTPRVVPMRQVKPPAGQDNGRKAKSKTPPFSIATSAVSFITKYVDYASSRTDAPPGAHELMAVAALSALAGPTPRLMVATSVYGMSLVIWCMYIVNSTVGRKTTVIDFAQDILEAVLGNDALIQWEGSPQGMIQRLQERDGMASVFVRDEYSGLLAQMNQGGHMAGLPQMFIRAFDGKVIENIRTRKKGADGEFRKDTDRVEKPYLVKMTASTRDSLLQRATVDNVLDGFLARFVFFTGSSIPRPVSKTTATQLAQREALIEHARVFYVKAGRTEIVDVSDDVLALAWELERAWLKDAENSTRPDAAGPSMKRLGEAVFKLSALIAIDETDDAPCITPADFQVARIIGERWKASTMSIIEELGATEFQRNCEAVLASINKNPDGIGVALLYRAHRRLRKRDFDEIMEALKQQEQIEQVQEGAGGRGRPAVTAYPFGKAPDDLKK